MYRRTICISALLALHASMVAAGDGKLDRATLRGVKEVNVVIDQIDPRLPKEGVAPGDLQELIETRLKQAGLNVKPDGAVFVGLQISAVRGGRGPYGLSYILGLYQPVQLGRDPSIRTVTKTWDVETILLSDPRSLKKASIEGVEDLVGRFVAAWRSVNSEPRP